MSGGDVAILRKESQYRVAQVVVAAVEMRDNRRVVMTRALDHAGRLALAFGKSLGKFQAIAVQMAVLVLRKRDHDRPVAAIRINKR